MSEQTDEEREDNGEVTKRKVHGYRYRAEIQNCINSVKATLSLNRKAITERDGETRIGILAEIAIIQSQLLAQLYELRAYEI